MSKNIWLNEKYFQILKKKWKQIQCNFFLLKIKIKFSLDIQKLSIALKYFQLVKNYLDRTDGTSNI